MLDWHHLKWTYRGRLVSYWLTQQRCWPDYCSYALTMYPPFSSCPSPTSINITAITSPRSILCSTDKCSQPAQHPQSKCPHLTCWQHLLSLCRACTLPFFGIGKSPLCQWTSTAAQGHSSSLHSENLSASAPQLCFRSPGLATSESHTCCTTKATRLCALWSWPCPPQ